MLRAPLVPLLASLRLTLVLLGLLLLAVVADQRFPAHGRWLVAVPLLLLSINLLAAIFANPGFRRQPALLVFHVALLALVLLAGVGRLTYLVGRIELTEGETFEGVPLETKAGFLHPGGLERLRLINEALVIDYSAYGAIQEIDNRVRWAMAGSAWQRAQLGIQNPLRAGGYRLYVTSGKGFAPVFDWQATGAVATTGSVHLPRFPSDDFVQAAEWCLPGGGECFWVQLHFALPILPPGQAARLAAPVDHWLVIRQGDLRHELRPGMTLALPGGRLTYRELRLWMGYHVDYDWTPPWLLAAGTVAVLALGWHFWRRFSTTGWEH